MLPTDWKFSLRELFRNYFTDRKSAPMITIALIDDAVNLGFFSAVGEVDYYEVNNGIKKASPYSGHLTHATICAGILKTYAPAVHIINLNIFPPSAPRANIHDLAIALQWCTGQNIDIVHLSVGSTVPQDKAHLLLPCQNLVEKGRYIVASVANTMQYTMPADFEGVIGVICDRSLKNYQMYVVSKAVHKIKIAASASHLLRKCDGTLFQTKPTNSFAAPTVTARLIKDLQREQKPFISTF